MNPEPIFEHRRHTQSLGTIEVMFLLYCVALATLTVPLILILIAYWTS